MSNFNSWCFNRIWRSKNTPQIYALKLFNYLDQMELPTVVVVNQSNIILASLDFTIFDQDPWSQFNFEEITEQFFLEIMITDAMKTLTN